MMTLLMIGLTLILACLLMPSISHAPQGTEVSSLPQTADVKPTKRGTTNTIMVLTNKAARPPPRKG